MNRLIKLGQPGCSPCEVLGNHLEERNIPHEDINVRDNPEKTIEYSVKRVPTLVVVDEEGNLIDTLRTYRTLDEVDEFIERNGVND